MYPGEHAAAGNGDAHQPTSGIGQRLRGRTLNASDNCTTNQSCCAFCGCGLVPVGKWARANQTELVPCGERVGNTLTSSR